MNINIKYIYLVYISFSCVCQAGVWCLVCRVDGTNNVLVVLYNIILENTPHAHTLVFY